MKNNISAICANCSAIIGPEDRFCGDCGATLVAAPQDPSLLSNSPVRFIVRILVAIAASFVVVIAYVEIAVAISFDPVYELSHSGEFLHRFLHENGLLSVYDWLGEPAVSQLQRVLSAMLILTLPVALLIILFDAVLRRNGMAIYSGNGLAYVGYALAATAIWGYFA